MSIISKITNFYPHYSKDTNFYTKSVSNNKHIYEDDLYVYVYNLDKHILDIRTNNSLYQGDNKYCSFSITIYFYPNGNCQIRSIAYMNSIINFYNTLPQTFKNFVSFNNFFEDLFIRLEVLISKKGLPHINQLLIDINSNFITTVDSMIGYNNIRSVNSFEYRSTNQSNMKMYLLRFKEFTKSDKLFNEDIANYLLKGITPSFKDEYTVDFSTFKSKILRSSKYTKYCDCCKKTLECYNEVYYKGKTLVHKSCFNKDYFNRFKIEDKKVEEVTNEQRESELAELPF